jgi:hypothetical protein
MSATNTPPAEAATFLGGRSVAAWAVRRSLIGLAILTVVVAGSAWLLHASIDPAAEAPTTASAQSRQG